MKILAVKANLIGSRFIRWGMDEPASHLAVEFTMSNKVFHSYGTGIHTQTKEEFYAKYKKVASIELPMSDDKESRGARIFKDSIPEGQHYDYWALFYFAYRAALHKYFDRPFPKLNSWQENEGFLCTEAIYLAANVYAQEMGIMILPDNKDYAMVSPWQAIQLVKKRMESCKYPFSYYVSSSVLV